MKKKLLGCMALTAVLAISAQAGIVLDVDFSENTAGGTIADGTRIRDTSGNGYHGFWGSASGSYDIVNTFNGGVGIDTSAKTKGHVFLRDGLTGIPDAWDGGTTSTTPYFTLASDKNYTFESVVKFASTDAGTAGRDGLMGQTGGNEAWMRADNGSLQYAFVSGGSATQFGTNIDISSAYDGEFHNITVVLDRTAGEIRSYLDGSLLYTDDNANIATMGAMLNGTSDIRLGAYNTADADAFTGVQNQYRVSNTALATGDFIAIPEPATLGMVGLFGGAILFVRRKLAI